MAEQLKTIRDVDVSNRKILVRVDLNVPLHTDGSVADDWRLLASVPTIRHIVERGGAAILASHLGRPVGDPEADRTLRMDRVAQRLAQLLGLPVSKANDVVGPDACQKAEALKSGEVLLLENLRFHPGEQERSPEFAAALARLAQVYCNDAFGTCHRKDASMVLVPQQFPAGFRVAGLLLERELQVLSSLMEQPQRPYVALLGGAKVSDKIGLLRSLLPRVDYLLVGGAMAYTFCLARGLKVGASLVEPNWVDEAKRLLASAGPKLRIPEDHVIAERPDEGAPLRVVEGDFPDGWYGLDIGPKTIATYASLVKQGQTVVWNGPMGKFENPSFRKGTEAMAQALAECQGTTVVGGGETAEAIRILGLADRVTHVSTGGGAFLAFLEGSPLPALEVLDRIA